jgi:hypothetical protein
VNAHALGQILPEKEEKSKGCIKVPVHYLILVMSTFSKMFGKL